MSETAFIYFVVGAVLAILAMFAFALRRGRRVMETNDKIEANQRAQMALTERQVAALERVADSLEKRG